MIAFMVAGTASGVGKTTVALAIMAALRERGLCVQPFKCGPDFLDAGHHSLICGRVSRNLDTWMLGEEANRETFVRAAYDADAAVIEGMMGLFDGVAGNGEAGSSAEIAKLLNLPVILVIDASKSARSIAAVINGFVTFDPDLRFAGIVLNGVNSESHYRLLEDAICPTTSIPLLGRIPRTDAIAIPERHLGLRTAEEETVIDERRQALTETARQYLNIEPILTLELNFAGSLTEPNIALIPKARARFGVARDKAFNFYYEDNFDLLRRAGAEIVFFSPFNDHDLPSDLDALYLGGGYPELYADGLGANNSMLRAIRQFACSGRPVYAECGGMLYLGKSVGKIAMAGVLPLEFEMTDRLLHFGYVEATFTGDCLLGPSGTVVRGHSFHYSRMCGTLSLPTAYQLRYTLSEIREPEGFCSGSVLASYVHLHFGGSPSLAEHFVARAVAARQIVEAAW
jgi:cobyrinic acid a,c-diamide synthase